ncbi:hypothetical protein FE391_01605 [Nonomuraea sp. KC401]|uniref:hypothetical protein n=1 Tax=unclassified Nonomuraea TaxID=2593643 RepID=UPI0010FF2FB1|nr:MULTISPECIES: hypothetical protein [unclassified Nonomuraea]NBE92159.1 hypothetical protein [Nonomuraea sp. K271]TLF85655.1 hypothetical protein FE391_01605 [Nonomuraea sp. KC401]
MHRRAAALTLHREGPRAFRLARWTASFGSRPQVADFRERLSQTPRSGALLGQHPDAVMSG